MNTRAAELSKFVIYESPLTVFSDNPVNVTGQPGEDFLKIVPTTWDSIHFISGYPGSSIVLAKQSGSTWFVGGMTNHEARSVKFSLGFLPAGKYRLTLWEDTKVTPSDPKILATRVSMLDNTSYISVHMAPSGGFAATLEKL